jgi:hypothetical protein
MPPLVALPMSPPTTRPVRSSWKAIEVCPVVLVPWLTGVS